MADKKASPKADALRAMREARYAEQQARAKQTAKELQAKADEIKPKPAKRAKAKPKTPEGEK